MLTVSEKATKSFEPISAGMHIAVCSAVIDLGDQRSEFQGKEKINRKVMYVWEVADETYTDEETGTEHPRTVSARYTMSLSPKGNLHKMLKSWRGQPFTAEELQEFDLTSVLGKGCQISIVHSEGDGGKVYANIDAVVPLPKGMTAPEAEKTLVFDLDSENALEEMNKLPEWVQNIIKKGITYKNMVEEPFTDEDKVGDDDLPFQEDGMIIIGCIIIVAIGLLAAQIDGCWMDLSNRK